jgi:hypothetical protein
MRTHRREGEAGSAELDLTPMIDVTFQLIIFFMVVSQITSQENVDLRLPDARAAAEPGLPRGRLFTVNIAPVGRADVDRPDAFGWYCYGETSPRSAAEMRGILAHEAAVVDPGHGKQGPDANGISRNVAVVRCDARCPSAEFGRLIELMAQARLYKLKIAVLKDRLIE